MGSYILAIDQSTTTTKAIIFDRQGEVKGRRDVNHKQIHPQNNYVEHDPDEIWRNLVLAVKEVIKTTGIPKEEVSCLSVTNQRETTMLWTEEGRPAYHAIVWQDVRAEDIVHRAQIEQNREYITRVTGLQVSQCHLVWP